MNENDKYKREGRILNMGCLTAVALIIFAVIVGVYNKEVNEFGSNHILLSIFIGILIVAWIFYVFYKTDQK